VLNRVLKMKGLLEIKKEAKKLLFLGWGIFSSFLLIKKYG